MDFTNRGAAQPATPARAANSGAGGPPSGGKKDRFKNNPLWLRVIWVVLLFSATIVVVALVALLYLGGGSKEAKQINEQKYQAVFLTNGQVYFGKLTDINSSYADLRGIFYLNVNQQVQPRENEQAQNNITLVKLGCELHGPNDQMVINRDQVTFWENLKSDGQVAKAIDQWIQQNPEGQDCQAPAASQNPQGNTEKEGDGNQ
jgi:hypothetical protein